MKGSGMRRGNCTNFGACGIADRRQLVTTVPGQPFVCPECHRPLSDIGKESSTSPLWVLGILVLLVGVGYIVWQLRSPSPRSHSAPVAGTSEPPSGVSPSSPDVILRLHGSNTIGAQLAPALAEAFLKAQGAQDVSTKSIGADEFAVAGSLSGTMQTIEIQAHGSATAFQDLAAGSCDIGMASRKIQASEAANLSSLGDMTSPASEHVLGLDGLAVIVDRSNPLSSLSKRDIARIFSGEVRDWKEVGGSGGGINLFARDAKSGTFDTFKSLVLGSKPLAQGVERIEDSRELSNKVSQNSNAIGFVGLPYVLDAKALAV
jgi:phosphate transport system substrate-binding protein